VSFNRTGVQEGMLPPATRHLVDPELLVLVDTFPAKSINAENLGALRAQFPALELPSAGDVEIGELEIEGSSSNPPVRVITYRPVGVDRSIPAILHIHGGGYITGCPEMTGSDDVHVARSVGCAVFSVAYRLAPEHVYPAALEDCYSALVEINHSAAALNIDNTRIAVMGESAGGGLAAGLVLLARDRGLVPIAFQLLVAPMTDDRTGIGEDSSVAGEFVWNRENNQFGWQSLLGRAGGSADVPYYAAASRAADLSGLPPTFISTGSLDLFAEENIEYARRLLLVGVPVELHVYPRAIHGFQLVSTADVAARADRDKLSALRRALLSS
jgi:acetyl esterase/lipase